MGLPSFFRTELPKRYNYRPVYYDKRKEELEERIKQSDKDGLHVQIGGSLSRGAFREHFLKRQKERKQSNSRILILILLFALISFFIFYR